METMKVFLTLTTFWAAAHTAPFVVKQLDPQKGVFLEPIGIGIMYEKTWTALTTVKLPDWEPIIDYLQYCDKTLLEVCSLRGEMSENRCRYWHGIILRDIGNIKEQISELKAYSGKTRKRRGLVDVVGKVSKFLFGTMDHEDSEDIYNRLQRLENNDKENLDLISKQMTIIKSNFDAVLAPIKELHSEQNRLKDMVNHFILEYTENIGKMEKEIRHIRVQAETSEIMLAVLTQMQDTQKILTHLFTLINALQQHKLHPLLLRASRLKTLYQNITKHVSLNDRLKDLVNLNEVIRVDHLLLEDKFLIKISIPLGKDDNLKVSKIYRYPVPIGHKQFALLNTKAEYVLTRNNSDNYRTLTKESFEDTCQRLENYSKESIYLCKDRGPRSVGQKNDCISNIIKRRSNTGGNPQYPAQVLGYSPQLLIKLESNNKWLFSLPEKQLLQSHCHNGTEQHLISGVGTLQTDQKCSFTLGSWELPVQTEEVTKIESGEANNTLTPTFVFNMEPITNFSTRLKPLKEENDHQEDSLDVAVQQTADLANEIHQLETQRLKERQGHHLWANVGISSTLIIALLLVIMYLCIQARKKAQAKPTLASSPRIVTISAPISHIPRESPHITPQPTLNSASIAPQPTNRKHVNFDETTYETPPYEVAPPTPMVFTRAPSIRIPRHSKI